MKYLLLSLILTGLLFAGCSSGSNTPAPATVDSTATVQLTSENETFQLDALLDKTWVLKGVQEESDENDDWGSIGKAGITIQFLSDESGNLIKGFSGCNTYRGVFEIDENFIVIDKLSNTERACKPNTLMAQEKKYLSSLVTAYSLYFTDNGESLVIVYGTQVPNMMFFELQPAVVKPTPSPSPKVTPKPIPIDTPTPVPIPTHVVTGTPTIMVKIYVDLQVADETDFRSYSIPVNVGFYPEGSPNVWLSEPGAAMYYFSGTTSFSHGKDGPRAVILIGPVSSGTYDITIDGPSTLLNVRRGVGIR